MAGPNVEVFKFGLYMFFPVWVMLKFGDPEWYDDYVKPYGEMLWPKYETTNRPPKTQPELQAELARIKSEREARRVAHSSESTSAQSTSSAAPSAVLTAVDNLRAADKPAEYNSAVSFYRSVPRGSTGVRPPAAEETQDRLV